MLNQHKRLTDTGETRSHGISTQKSYRPTLETQTKRLNIYPKLKQLNQTRTDLKLENRSAPKNSKRRLPPNEITSPRRAMSPEPADAPPYFTLASGRREHTNDARPEPKEKQQERS